MKHARPDYERIQDSLEVRKGGIPENEPVFLLRAQDKVAAQVVRIWAILHRANGGEEPIARMAETWANVMDKWPYKKSADLKT